MDIKVLLHWSHVRIVREVLRDSLIIPMRTCYICKYVIYLYSLYIYKGIRNTEPKVSRD